MTLHRKFIRFLKNNALALASLSIAFMSLYLTITAQREDREHKELLLRPLLSQALSFADEYSVALVNNGLGPALITNAVYYINNRCVAVDKSASKRKNFVQENYNNFDRQMLDKVTALVDEIQWKDKWQSIPGFHVEVPMPATIIGVNDKMVIYQMDRDFAREFSTKLWELGAQSQRAFDDKFGALAMSLPFRLKYCSMSEQYCSTSEALDQIPCAM